MLRLFVALRPPPALRVQLLAMAGLVGGARWQTDAQLHLTLAFLDTVDEATAERVDSALAMIDAAPVSLSLSGVGSFAVRGRVNSLWTGVVPNPGLLALVAKVRRAVRHAGVVLEERTFVPHITLARLNAASGPVDAFLGQWGDVSSTPERISYFGLYESRLGAGGSSYDCLREYRLSADGMGGDPQV